MYESLRLAMLALPKIGVLLGRCYGVFSWIHLLQRLSPDLSGYEQFA
jgi:hypothetical protein